MPETLAMQQEDLSTVAYVQIQAVQFVLQLPVPFYPRVICKCASVNAPPVCCRLPIVLDLLLFFLLPEMDFLRFVLRFVFLPDVDFLRFSLRFVFLPDVDFLRFVLRFVFLPDVDFDFRFFLFFAMSEKLRLTRLDHNGSLPVSNC